MRIFREKNFKRGLSLITLVVSFFCLDWGIGQLLAPITYATYFNHDIERIEKEDFDSIIVFVGASRVYKTFVPHIFEDKWGVDCVINAGSSSQPICGTYHELKDLIERVHPNKVYIGVTMDQLIHNNLQGRLIVYDRLSLRNRFLMGMTCFSLGEKKYLLDSYRFKDRFGIGAIKQKIKGMKQLIELNFNSYSATKEYYADTGFVYNYDTFVTGTIPISNEKGFSEDKLLSENLQYLDLCIDLCQKNNIEVNLVSGVTTVMRMYAFPGYQNAVDFYTKYAESKGIKYYNLNFLKSREIILPDELMHDYNHLNGQGAYVVSDIFSDIINKERNGEDIADCFYHNLDEFKKDVRRIVAVKADITVDEKQNDILHLHLKSLQNDDIKPVYRVLIKYTDNDYKVLKDWTSDSDIDIKIEKESGYVIRVEAGSGTESYGKASQEYAF